MSLERILEVATRLKLERKLPPKRAVDTHELAWAAGLFDGEGHISTTKEIYLRIEVSQMDVRVLDRFYRAVQSIGNVTGPNRSNGSFRWQAGKHRDVQAVVAMLWRFLSPVKRDQMARAIGRWNDAHGKVA